MFLKEFENHRHKKAKKVFRKTTNVLTIGKERKAKSCSENKKRQLQKTKEIFRTKNNIKKY